MMMLLMHWIDDLPGPILIIASAIIWDLLSDEPRREEE